MLSKAIEIKNQLEPILRDRGVLRASLFGMPEKIVVLVELEHDKSLFDLVNLSDQIEAALGKTIKIGTFRSVKPVWRDIIMRRQISIY